MENKKQLIELLKECIKIRTEAIPLYNQYLDTPEFFEGLPTADVERVKKALKTLTNDAERHKEIFQMLLTKVEGSGNVH